ncbi:MAG: hypothetical protein HFH92_18365 [Lachnospiraceae bacterium]|jgi:hypothetical protein|nr:hypothetical protein [Lachnospiraceae bacterium]
MIIEQEFEEADLVELERVFSKSMEVKSPGITKIIRICDFLSIVCMYILLGCSIAMIALIGTISKETILWAIIGVIGILNVMGQRKLKEKMKPMNVVKRKYAQPFTVEINRDTLVYKQIDFLYRNIKFIVEYKSFLFIRAKRAILVMKFNKEEKEELFSKTTGIHVIHEEEPFDIREIK